MQAADINEASIFTTKNQEKSTDAYFLTSGDKVRCFFEEKARTGGVTDKLLSINKIGHGSCAYKLVLCILIHRSFACTQQGVSRFLFFRYTEGDRSFAAVSGPSPLSDDVHL